MRWKRPRHQEKGLDAKSEVPSEVDEAWQAAAGRIEFDAIGFVRVDCRANVELDS